LKIINICTTEKVIFGIETENSRRGCRFVKTTRSRELPEKQQKHKNWENYGWSETFEKNLSRS